jgi:hypothetical protein
MAPSYREASMSLIDYGTRFFFGNALWTGSKQRC